MSTLFVTATPIGNLEDITVRAIRIFCEVDVILTEDTRQFAKLKSYLEQQNVEYSISASIQRFDEHTESAKLTNIITQLDQGKNIALVSDAGTPLISDPGYLLIRTIRSQTSHAVVPVPGPSALTTALSAAGLPTHPFYFYGFLPTKEAKIVKLFESSFTISQEQQTTFVAYESPKRLNSTVTLLHDVCVNHDVKAEIVIANELTKLHEKFINVRLPETIPTEIDEIKGEITLLWRYV